ncbi:MAG: acyl-CoA dehydrogenase family protein [Chloroflexi bacterium]|nr:acyl-CoA dehydrogenase family protein [Chloroflexota bacterium]
MDTTLSETQRLLRDSVRDYLRNEVPFDRIRELEREGGADQPLWEYLQGAGYLTLPFAESHGGEGGELTDAAILLEELTRRACVIPFLETTASARAIERHGDEALADEVVRGVIGGGVTIAPALQGSTPDNGAAPRVASGALTGERRFVDYGAEVSHHLVEATEDGEPGLYLVEARGEGVTTDSLSTIARTPLAHCTYDGAPARRAGGAEALQFLRRAGRALCAIQCVGNAQQALDMTVEYVGMRVQFGRPIGSFQAVQHHCANMATQTLGARFLTYQAVWRLDQGTASDRQIAKAKALASRAGTEVTMQAHILFGGIGYTEEYDLHFFSRHGKERALAWGSADECLRLAAGTLDEVQPWR